MAPSSSNSIKILSWNCQCIRYKITERQHHLESSSIDIAALSETWLSQKNNLRLHNYNIYRRDRHIGLHGGVAIVVKNSIEHVLLPTIRTEIIEAVGIRIFADNNSHIDIISCYFPGGSSSNLLQLFKKDINNYHQMKLLSNW